MFVKNFGGNRKNNSHRINIRIYCDEKTRCIFI